MARCFVFAAAACLAVGCGGTSSESPGGSDVVVQEQDKDGHTHDASDKLVWPVKDVGHEGFVISLGHHGDHFHVGDTIEPAAMIVRDGADVADARVFNSLVSEDGMEVLVAEIAMVFEPKTESEPAHYAQGGMTIPEGAEDFNIRFRIELPGVDDPYSSDVLVKHD